MAQWQPVCFIKSMKHTSGHKDDLIIEDVSTYDVPVVVEDDQLIDFLVL